MNIRILGWFCAGALWSGAAPAGAQAPQIVTATPTGPWQVNYADDSCRLARPFTDGTDKLAFVIDKFGTEPFFNVIVAGKALTGPADAKVRFAFGPSGAERTFVDNDNSTFGTYGPSLSAPRMTLIHADAADSVAAVPGEGAQPVKADLAPAPSTQGESTIRWLEVQRGTRPPVRFQLGPMSRSMEALRACTDELLTHWGIDVAADKTLSRRATPRGNPGFWVSSSDYPSHLIEKGAQGIILFRLSIAEDGSVSDCHIQQSTRPAAFDKIVCQILSRRARFDPALDASGKPIKSYWRSSFRFRIRD